MYRVPKSGEEGLEAFFSDLVKGSSTFGLLADLALMQAAGFFLGGAQLVEEGLFLMVCFCRSACFLVSCFLGGTGEISCACFSS